MASTKQTIFSLHQENFSGKVTIQKENTSKIIFFKKGIPIYIDSNIRSETLGQMLLNEKKITETQYMMILDKMEKTGRRQGDCIVELGYMTGFEVYEALRGQMERKFQNCFLFEMAEITAEEGPQHLMNVPEFPIDFFRVVLEVSCSMNPEIKKDHFPADRSVCLTAAGKEYLASKALQVREMKVLKLLDGKHSWSNIQESAMGDEETLAGLIDVLSSLKFLDVQTPLPQSFKRSASQVSQDAPPKEITNPGVRVIEIKEEPTGKTASPLYRLALNLDQPYYKLLSVSLQDNRFQIKKAYDALIRELSLDSIEEHYSTVEEKRLAEAIFDRITVAMTVMSDDKKRHDYLQNMSKKGTQQEMNPKIKAETAVQKAHVLMGKKKFDEAEVELKKAIELDPEEASYHVEIAELKMVRSTFKKEAISTDVEKEIRQALKLNPNLAGAYFQLGVYYKLKDDLDKALLAFMKTTDLDKNHTKANSEARLLNKRIEDKAKNTSTFATLFKKMTEKKPEAKSEKGKKSKKGEGHADD